jgi:hypothetical protein
MVQKELRKFSQWFWRGFLKWYDGGGQNGITLKRIFEVEASFTSQNGNFPFIQRDFWSFSFLFLFLFLSFLAPSLEDLGVSMTFEEKITSSKTYFQMASTHWRWMHIPEWSYARQHG